TKSAGAPTLAQFQNNNEIKLPAPTAGNVVYVFSEIGAWDDGRAAFMKIRKNATLVESFHAKKSGSPTGTFHILLEQYDSNTVRGSQTWAIPTSATRIQAIPLVRSRTAMAGVDHQE